jgi:hypothetical protein
LRSPDCSRHFYITEDAPEHRDQFSLNYSSPLMIRASSPADWLATGLPRAISIRILRHAGMTTGRTGGTPHIGTPVFPALCKARTKYRCTGQNLLLRSLYCPKNCYVVDIYIYMYVWLMLYFQLRIYCLLLICVSYVYYFLLCAESHIDIWKHMEYYLFTF